MTTAALILAAGRGARVGGPKALLLVDGVPLLRAHVEARREVDRVIVVTREEVARSIALAGATTIVRRDPDADGPAGSIADACDALEGIDRVVVTPVDVRPASSAAVRALLDGVDDAHDAARFVRGHPIAIRASILRDRYRSSPPPLRDFLRALGARVATLPLHDGASIGDLDHVDDVVAATGAPPRFWSHP